MSVGSVLQPLQPHITSWHRLHLDEYLVNVPRRTAIRTDGLLSFNIVAVSGTQKQWLLECLEILYNVGKSYLEKIHSKRNTYYFVPSVLLQQNVCGIDLSLNRLQLALFARIKPKTKSWPKGLHCNILYFSKTDTFQSGGGLNTQFNSTVWICIDNNIRTRLYQSYLHRKIFLNYIKYCLS